jgi:hypothetical protein
MEQRMKLRLFSLTVVFAVLVLLSRSTYAASLCLTPDFAQAAAGAEMIFSGKITDVERVKTSAASVGEYVVTFNVETWWKGGPFQKTRVLWLSSVDDECPFLPVGEVAEDYLVYADPSRSNKTRDQLAVVTVFNRTSRLDANLTSETFGINDWSKQTRISRTPTLNRADASEDIKLLRALRGCGCSSTTPPFYSQRSPLRPDNSVDEKGSACRTCLQGILKPF